MRSRLIVIDFSAPRKKGQETTTPEGSPEGSPEDKDFRSSLGLVAYYLHPNGTRYAVRERAPGYNPRAYQVLDVRPRGPIGVRGRGGQ